MGVGRFIHHFGAFLLFAATVLLVVVDITAPVVNDIAILKIDLNSSGARGSEINFGTFGYCLIRDNADDSCSKARIGYNPADVIQSAVGSNDVDLSNAAEDAAKALTHVMVLHPVATGLCFIAFLLALGAGTLGSLMSSLVALLAFFVTLVALACDFAGFAIIKRKVNDASNEISASWAVGIWLVLVAAILALAGTVIVFFTCCSGRRRRNRESKKMAAYQASPTRY
ncbi:palI [Fusarium albosuccineum]|uniref:PalI n=1 Tax=Fusarium albosuccineum TaxID=1237068 RepID=A0A8H4KTQ8_9HYPO|nr:palI [Fusarium albosuccineum]